MQRLTSAHAIALLALFIALGGGAYAATKLPKNSVTSKSIRNGGVQARDLASGSVRSRQLRDGTVGAADLAPGAVGAAQLADGAVGGAELADGAVGGAELADGAVGGAEIVPGAVTGAHIADGTVGPADLVPAEPLHRVGGAGEPAFGTGGDGDCLWRNGPEVFAPVGFRRAQDGRVHLGGFAFAEAGPGGDAKCGGPGEATDDRIIFFLPPSHRPARLTIVPTVDLAMPDAQTVLLVNGPDQVEDFPPGAVAVIRTTNETHIVSLENVAFRPAEVAARRSTAVDLPAGLLGG